MQKEEKQCGEYHTLCTILEIYDEMQKAIESGEPYQTWLDTLLAAAVVYARWGGIEV
jgi:hypothetical protein